MATQKPVIAKEDLILHNDAIGINQKVFAGQPVPPDLVSAYNAAVGAGDEVKVQDRTSVSDPDPGTQNPPDPQVPAIDDDSITRDQLNAIAGEVGVDGPDKLANKAEVLAEIKKKDSGDVAAALKKVLAG